MHLHHLRTCILLSTIVSAGFFSNIFDTAKDTLEGKNILKSLSDNVIESIESNELQAGLFVCNLFAGKPAAAAQVLGQTVSDELESDYDSLVSLVNTIPRLVESDWQATVSGGANAVSIAEEVMTAPDKIATIATAAWGALTSDVACAFKKCGTSTPPWEVMSSSCKVIFAQSTKPVSFAPTNTVAVTTTNSATQRTIVSVTQPSSTTPVVTQKPTTTLPTAMSVTPGSTCGTQNLSSPPANAGAGTTKTCCLWYSPVVDDSCYSIGKKYGVTLDQLRSWNTQIDAACSNLLASVAYCVSGVVDVSALASVLSSGASQTSSKSISTAFVTGSTSKMSTTSSTTFQAATTVLPKSPVTSTSTTRSNPSSTPTPSVTSIVATSPPSTSIATPSSSASTITRTTVVAQSASASSASASSTTSSVVPYNAAIANASTGTSMAALTVALVVVIAMYAL